jgi:hypothetical protein
MKKLTRLLVIGAVTLAASSIDGPLSVGAVSEPYQFMIGMGSPSSPQPWDNVHQGGWDLIVHTRGQGADQKVPVVQAQHGADCAAPPATHTVTTVPDSVFICRDHLMTAVNDDGFGAIVMTPPRLVDFSQTATIDFNVSTLQMSQGTWLELWITPFGENLVLPSDNVPPDLSGPPTNAIHVAINEPTSVGVYEISNFNIVQVPSAWQGYSDVITPQIQSAANRTHFQVQLSQKHVRYGVINYDGKGTNFFWTDADLPTPLGWNLGVIQLEATSYSPTKAGDCETAYTRAFKVPCTPDTWHWSNFAISSAVPFTIDHGSPDFLGGTSGNQARFDSPTPSGGFLRFVAKGATEVSFDGGSTWQPAQRAPESIPYNDCQFENYWMAAPANLTSALIRGRQDCYGSPWTARDVSVWSQDLTAPSPVASPSPSPTPTNVPTPSPTPVTMQRTPCTVQLNGQPVSGFCTGTFSQT